MRRYAMRRDENEPALVQTDPHSHQIASEAKAIALTAAKHAKTLSTHVERLLREKETLVIRLTNGTGPLPPELQR